MRKKFEEDLKSENIKIIKCSKTIRPNLTSIWFWLSWYGQLVAMKLDENSVTETDENELCCIIRCSNRHNKNENGKCCGAAAKVITYLLFKLTRFIVKIQTKNRALRA